MDPKPWRSTAARWVHSRGWELHHCGHMTANFPWALYAPDGSMVRAGALYQFDANKGMAWGSLHLAMSYVATQVPS